MGNNNLAKVGEKEGGEEGSVREGSGWPQRPPRQRVLVAGSPGARLSCCSQLRNSHASWTQAGGHGQGCLPDTHRAPFEEVAAVSLEPSLLPVALSAPSNYPLPSPGQGKLRCHNWELLLRG